MNASTRETIGNSLVVAGGLALPGIVGVAVGYWMADLGASWLPDTVGALSVGALAAGGLVLAGSALRGRFQEETPVGTRLRRRALAGLAVLAAAGFVRLGVEWVREPSPLTALDAPAYAAAFSADLARHQELSAQMEALLPRVEAIRPPGTGLLNADDERRLLEAWSSLFDQALVLDQVRRFHEDWYRFDLSRHGRDRNLRSFLLTFAAEARLVESALRFDAVLAGNDDLRHMLDAPHDDLGLPANSWSQFREQFLGARDQARVRAGAAWLAGLEHAPGVRDEAQALGLATLWDDVDARLAHIRARGLLDTSTATAAADAQVLRRELKRVWFPAQADVAEWMGDEKLRRVGRYLIPHEQVEVMEKALVPGDVLVARKNWYLSNVGLPGFWPHAILYVGDPAKLSAAFDADPEVGAWVASQAGEAIPFTAWIARRHPGWAAQHHEEIDGHAVRVIEAISEGVVLNSLDHVAGDYLAGLHPQRSPLARAQAVAAAFDMLGRPYDFDFDFATDHAIVCSELVWRAWRPAEGKEGLDIPTVQKVGRSTLPANELIRIFDEEAGRPDAKFGFVGFIDAVEKEGRTFVSDEASLRASYQRTKWDVAQK